MTGPGEDLSAKPHSGIGLAARPTASAGGEIHDAPSDTEPSTVNGICVLTLWRPRHMLTAAAICSRPSAPRMSYRSGPAPSGPASNHRKSSSRARPSLHCGLVVRMAPAREDTQFSRSASVPEKVRPAVRGRRRLHGYRSPSLRHLYMAAICTIA